MININIKSNKGITMITLIIAVIIMLVISSTLIYNINIGTSTRNLNNMYSDIQVLKDKIDLYYSSYEALPIIQTEYTNTSNIIGINQNDGNKYYVIDLEAFENLTLNYGEGYKEFKTTLSSDISDIYIVNEQSHNVYYVKGIKLDGKTYYTIPGNYTEVEVPSIADISLNNMNGNVATLTAKGVNKRNGISTMKVYVAGNEYRTYNYATNNTEMKIETIQIEELEFGKETYCYVEITDIEGQTAQSDILTIKNEDTIATAQDLREFATLVNAGNTFEGKTVALKNDIDLEGSATNKWTPIGDAFKGTLDGKSHTIKNLFISEDADAIGLFGGLNGTVKNLNVNGTINGRRGVGAIAGVSFGTIKNCNNYCSVNNTEYGKNETYAYIGGIVGNNLGVIEKCANYGQITGITCVGGVAGISNGQNAIIKECFNTAEVKSIGYKNGVSSGTAGVVGNNQSILRDVYNRGNVTASYSQVGGIVGWQGVGGSTQNAYNTGNISAPKNVAGGIASVNDGNIETKNIYVTGTTLDTATQTIATSTIGEQGIGTVIGFLYVKDVLKDNYFSTTPSVVTGWAQEEINMYLEENFIKDTNNINDGYPILKWQLEQNVQ